MKKLCSFVLIPGSANLMTAIVLVCLACVGSGKHLGFEWASIALTLVFAMGTFLSYILGASA